ncbi:helix-turn-helix domain-containing protein [Pseudomonas sp. DTU_2021_1001937_2_SI_NGA_ILE_001]|uniref:GlxA family transcriptional regulator n=1 Tax=Pseudomonas sp. DTU_2021_1001937_2_SI_NGA_ILE_001 TaxID=3077589 RepID=UPI0028FC2AB3|nr:helix-turn-helix domain-containing protein [Pseudomonas sp. DTU_2021_1001937_2_SI_NGA_ILE_001]WNW13870.1 helix-turn-helix domain-containing protein [Pseudomonas sp. DTU_2021_1001937_2_SI_NGA_ILE_001]
MRIAIVAVEGCLHSAVVGLVDLFWITNQALRNAPDGGSAGVVFETLVVSADAAAVMDAQGRTVQVDGRFDDALGCDAVLIAGMALDTDGSPPRCAAVSQAAAWLRRYHQHGGLVAGACAGAFVLGEAGLLDGRRCTTTWWLHPIFKRRFPKADAVWGSALEEHDRVISSGGPLSWIDLALHVIRRLAGDTVARLAASMAVTDNQALPQTVYAPRGFINATSPLLLQAEQTVRQAGPGLTAQALAKGLRLSERTLHRRLKELLNETPKAFITRVRIETACALLQSPGARVKQVAMQAGYADESSFRRAFAQVMGLSPSGYVEWLGKRRSCAMLSTDEM